MRINFALSQHLSTSGELVRRGTLIRIETRDHERIFRIVRYKKSHDEPALWLEYDDRARLRIGGKDQVELAVRKAYRIEYLMYLWDHTDPIVSIEFRLALFVTGASVMLGALIGLVL